MQRRIRMHRTTMHKHVCMVASLLGHVFALSCRMPAVAATSHATRSVSVAPQRLESFDALACSRTGLASSACSWAILDELVFSSEEAQLDSASIHHPHSQGCCTVHPSSALAIGMRGLLRAWSGGRSGLIFATPSILPAKEKEGGGNTLCMRAWRTKCGEVGCTELPRVSIGGGDGRCRMKR